MALVACGKSTATPGTASTPVVASSSRTTPTIEPSATPRASPSVLALAPTSCESFPNQAYTSPTYGFTIPCPSGFSWETFGSPYPDPSWQFVSRIFATQYVGNYPPDQIELGVFSKDVADLRGWVSFHIGQPMSSAPGVHWDSVSNVMDTTVAGVPAISFDYTHQGPGAPPIFHAVAFFVGPSSVFVIDWWSSNSNYSSAIEAVAQQVVAGIRVQ